MAVSLHQLAICLAVGLLELVIAPPAVLAQAWVPAKGEGAVGVAVQQLNVKKHLASTTSVDAGHINSVVLLADMTYGLTDKVAVDVAIPFVSSRYAGSRPHPNTTIDDGTFHSSFTDFRMSVRYNVTRKGAVITPYIGSIVPSHDYAYYGHAAFGERLNELQVGAYAAKLFTRGVPRMFVSSRVAYSFVEKVQDVSHNRTTGDLEVGYFLTPSFRVFGMATAQHTHGGIDLPLGGPSALPLRYQPVHDVIQKVHYLNAGGGFAYSLSDSVDMFASFSRHVAGRNGHVLNRGVTVGASWSFSRRSKGDAVASLVRCICQKSGM